jgi:chemotaxis protein methyltransferase CheR
MKAPLDDSLLTDLSRLVAERMGLHFPPPRWNDLTRAFSHAAVDLGFGDPQECIRWFMAAPASRELIESLSAYLTTGETYFLRERRSLEILEQELLPEIIRSRSGGEKRLRIWSAGCATGEEPYTLAILLHRMGLSFGGWNLSILGTDINPKALRKAAEGVYTQWSFRDTPAGFRKKYFLRKGDNRFELIPAIKKMVKFSYLNLAEAPCPALLTDTKAMDVIFCRNVLMYLSPERAEQAAERLRLCLADGGWLVVSSCEAASPLFSGFKAVSFSGITVYRRQSNPENEASRRERQPASVQFAASPPAQTLAALPPHPASPLRVIPPPAASSASSYEEALGFYQQGDSREAVARVTAHLSLHREDARALALLCRLRADEGLLDEALQLSEQALRADKLDVGLHYLQAMILQEEGDFDAAVASLKRALYLDHDLVLAHFTLGNIAHRQGKSKESRKHFGRALAILARYQPEDLLPESDGMPAGRLTAIIKARLPA